MAGPRRVPLYADRRGDAVGGGGPDRAARLGRIAVGVCLLLVVLSEVRGIKHSIGRHSNYAAARDQLVELLAALMQKHDDIRNAVEKWVARSVRKGAATNAVQIAQYLLDANL